MSISFSILFPLFCIVLGVLLISIFGYLYFSSRNMDKWQIAEGIITKSSIKHAGATYSPEIQYQYSILGAEYQGTNVTIILKQTYQLNIAQEWVSQYPVGKKVNVFYNPDNYRLAVLEKGFSLNGVLVLIGTALFFILFGGGLLFMIKR